MLANLKPYECVRQLMQVISEWDREINILWIRTHILDVWLSWFQSQSTPHGVVCSLTEGTS
jgi:hypothetical protein